MFNQDHRPSPVDDPRRRRLLSGASIALVIVGVALFFITRGDDLAATSRSVTPAPAMPTASTTTTVPHIKSEIVARLREILQIRERALIERDASLFDDVYTSTCPCLRAGRDAVAALKKENILWRDRSISIEIQSVKSVSSRLWEVVALFISDSFRIETEEGRLVRQAPSERLRYRFLLVRTSESEPWRLGGASSIEG